MANINGRMHGWMDNDILPPHFMAEASKYYCHLLCLQIPSTLTTRKDSVQLQL